LSNNFKEIHLTYNEGSLLDCFDHFATYILINHSFQESWAQRARFWSYIYIYIYLTKPTRLIGTLYKYIINPSVFLSRALFSHALSCVLGLEKYYIKENFKIFLLSRVRLRYWCIGFE
jgi:hypothetical protein